MCAKENTLKCTKYGDCLCKSNYYGSNCEFGQCGGILKCENNSTVHCVCEATLEQRLEEIMKHQFYFIISSILLLALIVYLAHKYNLKTKKLKNELKIYTLRYSSDRDNLEFSNLIYKAIC